MKHTRIPLSQSYRLLNHGPLTIISSTDGKTPNACPIAWIMPLDFRPALFIAVISGGHKTFANLKKTKQLVINIPTLKQKPLLLRLGGTTGHQVNKLRNTPTFPALKVKPPCLKGCIAWIEVKVKKIIPRHDLVILEALAAFAAPGAWNKKGYLNLSRFSTLHHVGDGLFGRIRVG